MAQLLTEQACLAVGLFALGVNWWNGSEILGNTVPRESPSFLLGCVG